MNIPTVPECYRLMSEYSLPINIIRHSEQVAKISVFLGKKLIEKGKEINLELLRVSALLHDIAKPIDFKHFKLDPNFTSFKPSKKDVETWKKLKDESGDLKHEQAGVLLLQKLGYVDVAKIVGKHGYSKVIEGFDNYEEKILYYADKLVKHDQIRPMKERLEEGHKRYVGGPPYSKEVEETDKKIFELEEELLKKAGVSQKDIIELNNICIDKV
ncbi:hypothetical protein C0585_08100 [Candidatus Woesearchaeota archaeon]|nr:MAG: hypothetical protein C0585_08100 [Candidatus Woesearchaeota archaeon]